MEERSIAFGRLVDLGSCFCGGVPLYLLRGSIKLSAPLAVGLVAVVAAGRAPALALKQKFVPAGRA